ncbi:MAG: PsiF family protein [Betaproteobacteria bacterium]
MKLVVTAIALSLAVSAPAFAKPQQEKMKLCSTEAKTRSLKGDDRRAFMSQCLAATAEEKQARQAQLEKSKACVAEAKSKALKGEARKKFVNECSA